MQVIAIDNESFVLTGLTRTIKKIVSPDAVVKGFRLPSDALQYAREHSVDVAFLSIESAQMHGLITAKKLKRLNPKVSLIFMSESFDYGDEAWNLHASGYIHKPFDSERIEQEFRHLRYTAVNTE